MRVWARLPPPTSPGNATNAAGVTARGGHRPATAGHCGRRPRGAFFPGAAPEPGWRRTQQPGPWGRWPTRRCAGEQHLTTDLPENASGAAGVTANGDLRRRKRPRGPPSRGRSLSTYQQERVAAFSRYIGAQTMPDAPYVLVVKWGQEASPVWPLTPSVATRKHGYLVAPSPGQARGRLQVRTGGSRGGAPYGSRPHWWTGYQIERLCNGSRYVRSARARRGALGLQEPIHHQQQPIRSSTAWLAVRQSASLSTPVGTPSGRESWILDRLALPGRSRVGSSPADPQPAQHRAAQPQPAPGADVLATGLPGL
jgi:hypothetical protein